MAVRVPERWRATDPEKPNQELVCTHTQSNERGVVYLRLLLRDKKTRRIKKVMLEGHWSEMTGRFRERRKGS